jgi:ribosomal-protein-alanine N-acetyltransferase
VSALAETAIGYHRAMLKSDLKEIRSIEQQTYEFPWSKGIFMDCIKAGYHCRVLQLPGGIGAYGIMSVAAEESHILNLCVCPRWQGRGLARRLLDHLMDLARNYGAATIFLEVRPSNVPALRLYRAAGFNELGTRPGYYPAGNGREDALIMAKTL